ncbi:flavin-containing monooxygenase [Cupriavidus basilensis]|uniref:flavin-containing monooxygenase n=1 Tax=Cupriavidus basilensis TaxID=68895 RepID=UPI0023E865F3|nr:NAD(P)/FAD-dependent oxidoreductase [Cupriavidus basilensis]MDF3882208.1 NAD(P)/FAD-dependent oxidoreductase [Cupriavidus basilensis]
MDNYDAIVVGAGFSGLYMLHRLREAGLSARVYEVGDNVGGVWYWNRYPGARCDVESIYYNFTFSKELLQEWTWTSRYAEQPEILAYLNHVADRFDLRRDIQFDTRVVSAHYIEAAGKWRVETNDGRVAMAKYFISGVGCLSTSSTPRFEGLDTFGGEQYHTGTWPHEPVSFEGKRVGVIGTGSSGVQAIPQVARQAAHLYVFQRTAQYSTPAANRPYDREYVEGIKANYPAIREQVLKSWGGTTTRPRGDRCAFEDTEAERRNRYEQAWKEGGWMHGLYKDLVTDPRANETVGEFIRGKIREIVKAPEIAAKLAPTYLYGVKRPVMDTGYFETYNRDNVTLVDVKADPIVKITPTGLRTRDADYPLDAIIFATGYDAMTGALFRIDIRGKDGVSLRDKWSNGERIRTYLGLATAGFPNMFTITGPESPSVLSNMVWSIEQHVEWIDACIRHMEVNRIAVIEAKPQAEEAWSRHCHEVADATLFPKGDSWYNGSNVEGKKMSFPIYLAGISVYREICDRVAANGYDGFQQA